MDTQTKKPIWKKPLFWVAVLIVLGVIGSLSNKGNATPNASSPTPSATASDTQTPTSKATAAPTATATPNKAIPIAMIDDRAEGGNVLLDPMYLTEPDMEAVGLELKDKFKNDPNIFVSVFTDRTTAGLRDKISNDTATAQENALWDKNYVGQYTKNANSGFNTFQIYLKGNGSGTTNEIKY